MTRTGMTRWTTAAIAVMTVAVLATVLSVAAREDEMDGTDAAAGEGGTIEIYSVDEGRLVETAPVERSEEEWRRKLSDEQFRIAREHGTERAFNGPHWDRKDEGVYRCAACGADLFLSTTKFESGTGWPSFTEPVHPANIGTSEDRSLFWQVRTEVHCARCGAHLGHVFDDGPPPTGLRYCLNGTVLEFEPKDLGGDGEAPSR